MKYEKWSRWDDTQLPPLSEFKGMGMGGDQGRDGGHTHGWGRRPEGIHEAQQPLRFGVEILLELDHIGVGEGREDPHLVDRVALLLLGRPQRAVAQLGGGGGVLQTVEAMGVASKPLPPRWRVEATSVTWSVCSTSS